MEQQNIAPTPKRSFPRLNLGRHLDNPVITKELRGRMRDRRTFILLTFYLSLIASFVTLVYTSFSESYMGMGFNPDYRQILGKSIFGTVVIIELLLIGFIAPGLTAGAITSEREHRTLDLLKTTLLTARELVLGKLGASIIYLLLLIFTVLPIQSLAFLLGGVGPAEVIISTLLLIVTAVFFSTLGIFFSSVLKRTLAATVSSYGSILLSVFALIFFVFSITFFIGIISSSGTNSLNEDILLIVVWLIVCTNPILTPIVSEMILIEDQSIWVSSSTSLIGTGQNMISPWIIYILIYSALTIIMIFLSIWFVRRPER